MLAWSYFILFSHLFVFYLDQKRRNYMVQNRVYLAVGVLFYLFFAFFFFFVFFCFGISNMFLLL
jgi:hypothetical protein